MIVMPQLWTGGIQKMNVELAAHMDDPRVEIAILSLYPRSGAIFEKQADDCGINVVYLNKHPGVDLGVIRDIYRAMKEYRPDVLHVNQRMTTYVLLPMLLLRIPRRYYVVHSLADMDARGLPRLVNRFAFHCLRMVPIAISDFCRKSISNVYKIPENRIPCIYNGISLDRFMRKTPYEELPTSECVFVTSCAFRPEKNLSMMISAFGRLNGLRPNTRLVLLGDGETMDAVRSQIAELGLEACVDVKGYVRDVPGELHRAHVYLLSSDWEGLPVSILEAMGAGLPVIATRAGGVVDIVRAGENGLLVDVGDENGFCDAMRYLADHVAIRIAFSKASEARAGEYGMDHCVKGYVKAYVDG
jgi:glycosyltransferase involved in cell wall biosynthesis